MIKTFLTFGEINFKKQHSSTFTCWKLELLFLRIKVPKDIIFTVTSSEVKHRRAYFAVDSHKV